MFDEWTPAAIACNHYAVIRPKYSGFELYRGRRKIVVSCRQRVAQVVERSPVFRTLEVLSEAPCHAMIEMIVRVDQNTGIVRVNRDAGVRFQGGNSTYCRHEISPSAIPGGTVDRINDGNSAAP
jgi:hypothetical protein